MTKQNSPEADIEKMLGYTAEGYQLGFSDAMAKKYPSLTRAEIADNVINEILSSDESSLMTEKLKMQKAVLRALEIYVQALGFTPDLRPEVQRDTYPGLLEGNGYSPLNHRVIDEERMRIIGEKEAIK